MAEQAFVAPPITTAGGKVIASPFQFYTTGEDHLQITSFGGTDTPITVQGRFLDAKGRISASAWVHTPSPFIYTAKTERFALAPGAVLNLTVSGTQANDTDHMFVKVQLVRGLGAPAIVLGTLLEGYVSGQQSISWPGSPLQHSLDGPGDDIVATANPPVAGAAWTGGVPVGARWELLAIKGSFAADATVASRDILLAAGSLTALAFVVAAPVAVTAGGVLRFSFGQGMTASVAPYGGDCSNAIPRCGRLRGGTVFTLTATNLQPGDLFSGIVYSARRWIDTQ